jgi:inositol-1,4,5-trisphosphate 5-phosphatase
MFIYLASSFHPVVNRQIFAGNLVNAQTLRKQKYPREFFPEVKKKCSKKFLLRKFFLDKMVSKRFYTNSLVNKWLVNIFKSFISDLLFFSSSISIFDLLNVHLFHDASNLLAAERSPSIYSKCRRNALKYTLER